MIGDWLYGHFEAHVPDPGGLASGSVFDLVWVYEKLPRDSHLLGSRPSFDEILIKKWSKKTRMR